MIRNWRIKKNKPKESFPLILTVEILCESQNTILELVRTGHFSVEHRNLKSQTPFSKRSKILPLVPILVDNFIKVGGCIRHSNIPDQQKHQTILPAAHHVTSLVVTQFHEKYHHYGRDQTLASIREEFWILNGKSVVRRILDKCLLCRRLKVKSKPQFMSDLLAVRLEIYEPAFSYIGVDYFGPIFKTKQKKQGQIRDNQNTVV